jgi:uncharacterized protein YdiU (UPF0061 family)
MNNPVQVKFTVDSSIAEAFKAACKEAGVSMASEFIQFMADKIGTGKIKPALPSVVTRQLRRRELKTLIMRLSRILNAEEICRNNTPKNLQESEQYETTETCIEALSEVIEMMEGIYE